MTRFRTLRMPHALFILIAVLAAMSACNFSEIMAKDAIKGRAQEIVNGILKDDTSIEYQNAVYAWGKGVEFAGAGSAFDAKESAFRQWLNGKEIRIPVASAEIGAIEMTSVKHPYAAIVQVTLNGTSYRWHVEEGKLVSWLAQ